ncbi:CPBP family intramembrane glutamic endopeptidase [Clostridium sp. C105KSO13]|uniref:CPBP family intramembrane glutamic endopeptidase n=1 Tax=Clostridium sp. C105KSO13 TaxID=1776045 RepID=UPI0007405FF3|nr:type II CAAX endopeptidase family protein [Clostridium sp. C105KSO13]CUX20635.1 CAAX amino terminal protease self-immunity [Clostridium sp. C105KSO13]
MNKNPNSKRFWRLAGPILLYWAIDFFAKFVIEMIVLAPYMGEIMSKSLTAESMTQQEIMELALKSGEKAMEIVQRYQVEILGIAALVTIPLTLTLFLKDRKREKLLQLPLNKKAGVASYPLVIVLGGAVCIGMSCLSIMTNLAFISDGYQTATDTFYSAEIPAQIVVLGIIIPLAEELMFRGILYRRYREKQTLLRAALYSTLLFSITHGNIVQFLYSFLLGMILAYVYEKYGSFKAPAALHITANIVSLTLTNTGGFAWLAVQPVRMAAATVASAFIGSVMFVLIQKIDEKPEDMKPADKNEITPDMFR